MLVGEALRVLEYNSIYEVSEEETKKRYRRLVKKYHPDSNKGKEIVDLTLIKDARDTLDKYCHLALLENAGKVDKRPLVLSPDTIRRIYNDEQINIGDIRINKGTLKERRVYLDLAYTIEIDGISSTINPWLQLNSSDIYTIDIELRLNPEVGQKVKFELLGESREYLVKSNAQFKIIKKGMTFIIKYNVISEV